MAAIGHPLEHVGFIFLAAVDVSTYRHLFFLVSNSGGFKDPEMEWKEHERTISSFLHTPPHPRDLEYLVKFNNFSSLKLSMNIYSSLWAGRVACA